MKVHSVFQKETIPPLRGIVPHGEVSEALVRSHGDLGGVGGQVPKLKIGG
jgi:hypothetical protein